MNQEGDLLNILDKASKFNQTEKSDDSSGSVEGWWTMLLFFLLWLMLLILSSTLFISLSSFLIALWTLCWRGKLENSSMFSLSSSSCRFVIFAIFFLTFLSSLFHSDSIIYFYFVILSNSCSCALNKNISSSSFYLSSKFYSSVFFLSFFSSLTKKFLLSI